MATVHITASYASTRNAEGVPIDALSSEADAESIESSGTSQATTITAPTDESVWEITTDGPVWVTFGDDPTAEVESGHLLGKSGTYRFAAIAGDKAAVISV